MPLSTVFWVFISIHPPRVGRDWPAGRPPLWRTYFNPPSPCGEGPFVRVMTCSPRLFQSTLPVWGGTMYILRYTT